MSGAKNERGSDSSQGEPSPSTTTDPFVFQAPLFGGVFSGSGRETSPGRYLGIGDYRFANGDTFGGRFAFGTDPAFSIDQYGLNGSFALGRGGGFRFDAEAMPPSDTVKINSGLRLGEGYHLNTDWSRGPNGRNYGGDAGFLIGSTGSGTANLRADEAASTTKFDTRLNFAPGYHLNADFLHAANGRNYGGDAGFLLGNSGSGIAALRVDEPSGITKVDTRFNFAQGYHLNADWSRTPEGQIYGGDAGVRFGESGTGSFGFRVDQPAGTTKFETHWKFDDANSLNADWMRNRYGQIYGGDGTFGFGRDGRGSASLRVNEPEGTAQFATQLQFGDRGGLNLDWNKTPGGHIYGASGSYDLDSGHKANAGFRINGVESSSSYTLGMTFPGGNQFNAGLMTDRFGTTVNADTRFNFAKGAGAVVLEGRHGPQLSELGGSVVFKNPKLEYSGHIKLDDQSGRYQVSEFGAKLATTGSDRYRFTAEAGYQPGTGGYYGKVGLTISFGGGPKSSRASAHDDMPRFERRERLPEPERPATDPVSEFKRRHPALQQPENGRLFDQAVAGVRKLNAGGQDLPVAETALSLAVLAKTSGIADIRYVALGGSTSTGQRNLFIGEGDPSAHAAKTAHIDKNAAALTLVEDNLRRLDATALADRAENHADPQMQSADAAMRTGAKRGG